MQNYNSKFKSFLIIALLTVILASPITGLAQQFKTQQNYPSIGGSELIKQKASESLPSLVKYLFNLAVWLCILAAILALIIGGVQYVTASGQVEKMRSARTKIYSAFLGLAILIGSYLILHTTNPQLVIPHITYQPIKSGIVLFTKTGYDKFKASSDPSIINDLVSQNEARLLFYSTPDLTAELGDLVVTECSSGNVKKESSGEVVVNLTPTKLDFENFPLYTIGFWGKRVKGATVVFYDQKDYKSDSSATPEKYTAQGKINATDNKPVLGSILNSNGMQIINFAHFSNFKTDVSYLGISKFLQANGDVNDLQGQTLNISKCDSGAIFNLFFDKSFREKLNIIKSGVFNPLPSHPALSVKIEMNGPGVYLADAAGNERYFDSSVADLAANDINFNQMAKTIKIINDVVYKYVDPDGNLKEEKETNDLLVIAHEGDNFSGHLKIYYEARRYDVNDLTKTTEKAKNKFIPAFTKGGTPVSAPQSGVPPAGFFKDKNNPFLYFNRYVFGHLPPNQSLASSPLVADDYKEQIKNLSSHMGAAKWEENYGGFPDRVSVSSLEIYELAEDPSVCEEVRLCTEKQGRGYCIAYVAKDSIAKTEPNTVFYPMPVYEAQNILCPDNSDILKTCPLKKMTVKTPSGDKNVNFAKEGIKSIIIKPEGKCAIVLFENYLFPYLDNLNDPNSSWHFSGWEESIVPGPHSEVFTYSDYDLTNNQIGMCGAILKFSRWISHLCAASIAVFPIK